MDLKECFRFDDGGVKPVRASRSRWVTHKLNAMKRVISKYGHIQVTYPLCLRIGLSRL